MKSMARLLKKGLIMALVVFLVATVYELVAGWMFLHPRRSPVVGNPKGWGMAYQSVQFGHPLVLSGWWIPQQSDHSITVIIAHGYSSNRSEPCIPLLAVIRILHDMGVSVLDFDFRAHGFSQGNMATIGALESRDLNMAVDYTRRHLAPGTHIILLGYSMGASTALLTAESNPYVSGIIADSPYDSLKRYLEEDLPIWQYLPRRIFQPVLMTVLPRVAHLSLEDANPASHLRQLGKRPLLIIAGQRDPLVPVHNAVDLYHKAQKSDPHARLWVVRGAGHIQAFKVVPFDYAEHLYAFLSRWGHLHAPPYLPGLRTWGRRTE